MTARSAATLCLLGFLVLVPVTPALPADTPAMGDVVPADVHFFTDWRNTDEYQRLMEPYEHAMEQLMKSGIGEDIMDMALADAPQEWRDQVMQMTHRVWSLLKKPDWNALLGHEGAFSFRLSFPIPEYLLLCRVPEGTAAARRSELRELLAGLAEMIPETLVLEDSEKKGGQVSRLGMTGAPIGISVAAKGNYVGICTSDLLVDSVLDLIGGDGTGSVARESTFKKGFQGLEGDAVSRVYFNLPGYVRFMGGMMGMAASGVGDDPNAQGVLSMARTVIGEVARLGPIFSVGRVEGNRMVARTKMDFVQGENPGFIEELVAAQKPIERWEAVIPKDAHAFYFTSGINPARVYDGIEGLMREKLPAGERMLERWERMQARVGFHLRSDLLSWIDGGAGWVSLPPKAGGWCSETVFFMRLSDEEKARALIQKVLGKLKDFLASRGQRLDFVEVPGMGERVREVRLEAFPWMRPVIGIRGELLILASSTAALQRVVDTFREEAPNITANPAYAAMKFPEQPMQEVFYMDLEGSLQGIANVLSGAGFVAAMVPEKENNRQLRKLSSMLGKLAAFVRALDVVTDYGGWTLYDAENHALISEQTTTIQGRSADF